MSTICSSSPPLPPSSHLNLSTLALDAEARAETEEPEEEEEEEELPLLVEVDQRAEGEGAEHSRVSDLKDEVMVINRKKPQFTRKIFKKKFPSSRGMFN